MGDRGSGRAGSQGRAGSKTRGTNPVDMLKPSDDPLAALEEVGSLTFKRVEGMDANTFMGTARRSAITGDVFLMADGNWPDFDLADLWTRGDISGNLRQFAAEKHLFLPIPMAYRSWIYHDLYLQKKVLLGKDKEHAMVTAALSVRCIDVHNLKAGRWSPIMCYGPIVLICCLTGDMFLVIPGVFTVIILFIVSRVMNNPQYYRYVRLALLPIRTFFMAFFLMRLQMNNAMALFFSCLAMGLMIIDFFAGDLQTLLWYRLNCSYEIIKILPNRVFICRRHGASHQEEVFGSRGTVAESITALGAWQRSFYIIADINGVLAELRPVNRETWLSIYDEQCESSKDLSFQGIDVFTEDHPAIGAFGARYKERQAVIEKFKREQPEDSLLYKNNDRKASHSWAEAAEDGNESIVMGRARTTPLVVVDDM